MHHRVGVIINNPSVFFGVAFTEFDTLLEQREKRDRKLKLMIRHVRQ